MSKKIKKWLFTLLSIMVLFNVLLAACSSKNNATETPVNKTPTASEQAREAEALGVEKAQESLGEFAIFLVRGGISAQQMMAIDLDDLEVESNPILSVDDLVSYTEKTHSLELTDAAYVKITGLETTLVATTFVVYVGREPIYAGAFWATYFSSSFDGIVIDILPALNKHPYLKVRIYVLIRGFCSR